MMTRHYPGVTGPCPVAGGAGVADELPADPPSSLSRPRPGRGHVRLARMLAEYFGLDLDDLRKEMDCRHALGRNDYEDESLCEDEEEEEDC